MLLVECLIFWKLILRLMVFCVTECIHVCVYACMCVHVCMYDVRHNIQIPCTRYVAINHLYLLRPGCKLLLLFPRQLPSSPRVHIVDMKKVTRDDTRPKTSTASVNCHRKRHETVGSDMSHRLASQSFHCHTASEHFRWITASLKIHLWRNIYKNGSVLHQESKPYSC